MTASDAKAGSQICLCDPLGVKIADFLGNGGRELGVRSTPDVLFAGDWLNVVGIDAVPVPTPLLNVVQMQAGGDGAFVPFIDDAMSVDGYAGNSDLPIPGARQGTLPEPAAGLWGNDVFHRRLAALMPGDEAVVLAPLVATTVPGGCLCYPTTTAMAKPFNHKVVSQVQYSV